MASQPSKTILQSVKPDQSHETMTNSSNASPDRIAVMAKPLISAAPPVDEFMCASLQAKKSSFMITRVVAKPDGDSLDDLDDVTNTEEMSSVADTTQNRWSSIETVHSPCEYSPRSPVQSAVLTQGTGDVSHQRQYPSPSHASSASVSNDVQSRFRIVKVESRKPFLRGRWTCVDFADAPSVAQNGGSSDPQAAGNNPAPLPLFVVDNLQGGYVPAFVYSDGLPVLEHNPFNALTCGNIYDASVVPKQNDVNLGEVSSTVSKVVEGISVVDVFPNPDSMTRRPSDFLLSSNATNLLVFQDRSNNPDSSVSTFAIDNKIEQAMDLVKSHLMFAVHEEVELLKEQIKDLMMKNAQLEYENNVLRAAASPETLAILEASIMSPSAGSHLLGQLASSEIS